jgi:hypothetical protein
MIEETDMMGLINSDPVFVLPTHLGIDHAEASPTSETLTPTSHHPRGPKKRAITIATSLAY